MDELRRYWGELNNWTPKNEEERQDQQLYIGILMEAEELYRKERMSDEEFARNFNLLDSDGQRQQFMDDHISESEYVRELDDIHEILTEMNNKYGFGQGKIENENEIEISRKREELIALQAYFRVLHDGKPINILGNERFETMSQNDLVDTYERVLIAMSRYGNNFSEYVRLGKEVLEKEARERDADELEKRREAIRKRLEKKGIIKKPTPAPAPSPSDGNNGGTPSDGDSSNGGDNTPPADEKKPEEERIKEKIEKFKIDSEEMKKEISKVKAKLILGEENKNFGLTEEVKGLESELNELANEAEGLKNDIDAFVRETGSADFSMTPAQIEKRVSELKKGVKDLKRKLVTKYDARVMLTNAKIVELKKLTDLEPEVAELINGLVELQKCDVTVKSWTHNSFLKIIDFNNLVEVNKVIANIEKELGKTPVHTPTPEPTPTPGDPTGGTSGGEDGETPTDDLGLEADIYGIEKEIKNVESEINPDLDNDNINRLIQDLDNIHDSLMDFDTKLKNNKDKLKDDEYNNYVSRFKNSLADLERLKNQLKSMIKPIPGKNEDFDKLLRETNSLSEKVDKLLGDVEALYGLLTEGAVAVFESRLNNIEQDLATLKNDIESKHKDNKIDVNQYKSLMNKVKEMEDNLSTVKGKLKDPKMIKESDIFEILNKRIGVLEEKITELETRVEGLKAPIKDKETRKLIENTINALEDEIRYLEESLEKYKKEDENKYNATKARLDKAKDKLNDVCEAYRKKCPLLVRAVKSAKAIYKKHKKVCLVVAGLAAFALISHHVLIPAIMHGNMMIWQHATILRPFVEFTNKILGWSIGATEPIKNGWTLSNGVLINGVTASSSLLKGLAVSGVNSTLFIAPQIIAIKKLVEKMKTVDLKKKYADEVEKLKGKLPSKEKNNDRKPSEKKADKYAWDKARRLLEEYRKSGQTYEEFIANLDNNSKTLLNIMLQDSEEYKNAHGNTQENNRKGRR